jgi:hypothetical protein
MSLVGSGRVLVSRKNLEVAVQCRWCKKVVVVGISIVHANFEL